MSVPEVKDGESAVKEMVRDRINSPGCWAAVFIKHVAGDNFAIEFFNQQQEDDEESFALVTGAALGLTYVAQSEGLEGLAELPTEDFLAEVAEGLDQFEDDAAGPYDLARMVPKGRC